MNGEPDKPAPPPLPEGAGVPPNPDPEAEAKKRDIDREVYARRTAPDKQAEGQLGGAGAPLGKA